MAREHDARTQSARAYARTLERALADLHDGPVVFTHRDWDLASRWHELGIPVGVVLDALDAKRKRPPRGLGAVATAVEESWRVVQAGRVPTAADTHEPGRPVVERPGTTTNEAPDPAPEVLAACEREVDRRLAPYRDRMPPDRFESTRRRAIAEALRRARAEAGPEGKP